MGRASLAVLAALATAPAFATEGQDLAIRIEASKASYIRGEVDPAKDLVLTVTVQNTSDKISIAFQRPALTPMSDLGFQVFRKGKPTGESEEYKVPKRVEAVRRPEYEDISEDVPVRDVALDAGGSAKFKLNVGAFYDFDAAGKYEITAKFLGATSNTVEVEVLPLKRVNAFVEELIERLDHFEMGKPDFPFMFYIVKSRRHWDEIVILRRAGSPKEGRYEDYRLCRIPRGSEAQMVTNDKKVSVLAKGRWGKWWLYKVDFSGKMLKMDREAVKASPDSIPTLTKGAGGEPEVQG